MTEPIIRATDLSKTYGHGQNRFEALRGVTFEIAAGESVAILGKSGSGKSTLMHVLALLDTPTAGTISLDGADTKLLRNKQLNAIRNKTFGFVFQPFFLNPNATVLENVVLPLKIAGVGRAQRRLLGMAALEKLELADKARNKATELSGGADAKGCHSPGPGQ